MDGQLSLFDLHGGETRPCDYRFKRYIGQKVNVKNHGIRIIEEIEPYYTYLSGGIIATPYDLSPVEEGEGMTPFEYFRDRYCGHQGANIKFDTDEEVSRGCGYKNEVSASCWDDWQKCTEANCPFFQRFEVKWRQL